MKAPRFSFKIVGDGHTPARIEPVEDTHGEWVNHNTIQELERMVTILEQKATIHASNAHDLQQRLWKVLEAVTEMLDSERTAKGCRKELRKMLDGDSGYNP